MLILHNMKTQYYLSQGTVEQLHMTSQVRENVWNLYRKRCIFNYTVAVERTTAKPLWYDNHLSVGSVASLLSGYTM